MNCHRMGKKTRCNVIRRQLYFVSLMNRYCQEALCIIHRKTKREVYIIIIIFITNRLYVGYLQLYA
jgi:hypothetical protein